MKRNVLRIALGLLMVLVALSLFADPTRPIQEGEENLAPIASTFDLAADIKVRDLENPNYSRRPEIFGIAYRTLYLAAVNRFPDDNIDVRNIQVTRKNYDSKNKKTNFDGTGRVVRLPEGQFSEAKALTRPLLEEEKPLVKGAAQVNFDRQGTPPLDHEFPFDVAVHDQAYSRLVAKAQEDFGPTADVRNMVISIRSREGNRTHYGAACVVIAK